MATIQSSPSWQLKAVVKPIQGDHHHLLISSYVPTARRPEKQVRFTGIFTSDELRRLRDVIDQVLSIAA